MLASSVAAEEAGNEQYRVSHMSSIFQEGLSFSGFERDYLGLSSGSKSFINISGISGVDSISDGRGAVFADFDNDGDPDILLLALQGKAHYLFRNNIGQESGFLRVDLEGTDSGRDAYGAVVRVKSSAGVMTKVKAGGSGFLAQHDPRLLFGLGRDPAAEWVEVTWPTGHVQRVTDVAAGSSIRLVEARPAAVAVAERRFRLVDPLNVEDALLATLTLEKGKPLPNLSLDELQGGPTELAALAKPGRRLLLNFWATWCIPCKREMPELDSLQPRFEDAGIDLVGVSIDLDREVVPSFLAGLGTDYPIYFADPGQVAEIFVGGQVFIPVSVLVDDRGRVLRALGGWSPATSAALHELIRLHPE